MLKQTIEYTDFDDNLARETLYFNLTKTELADNLHLQDELQAIEKSYTGDAKRELSTAEVKNVLDLVKTFMRLSYGVRSSDGKRFIKTDEQWIEFTQTAAYDSFLYSLFEDPTNALNFMTGILPKGLREAALKAAQESGGFEPGLAEAKVEALKVEVEATSPAAAGPTPAELAAWRERERLEQQ